MKETKKSRDTKVDRVKSDLLKTFEEENKRKMMMFKKLSILLKNKTSAKK